MRYPLRPPAFERQRRRLHEPNPACSHVSSIVSLERGDILTPQPDTLKALAAALDMPVSDLFTVAGWLPAGELPTLKPYLRAKYRQLDEGAFADLERYAQRLTQRHGGTGPVDREDEQP